MQLTGADGVERKTEQRGVEAGVLRRRSWTFALTQIRLFEVPCVPI